MNPLFFSQETSSEGESNLQVSARSVANLRSIPRRSRGSSPSSWGSSWPPIPTLTTSSPSQALKPIIVHPSTRQKGDCDCLVKPWKLVWGQGDLWAYQNQLQWYSRGFAKGFAVDVIILNTAELPGGLSDHAIHGDEDRWKADGGHVEHPGPGLGPDQLDWQCYLILQGRQWCDAHPCRSPAGIFQRTWWPPP